MHRKLSRIRTMEISALVAILIASIAAISPFAKALVPCFFVTTSTENGSNVFTAKAVNQASGTIDATGCDIGDYIDNDLSVSGLTVHDADKFGIFVDSGCIAAPLCVPGRSITVTISGANVTNIGYHNGPAFMPNGVQFGIGILYDSGNLFSPLVKGYVDSSTVSQYQKGGIVIKHNANVNTTNNSITGLGPVDFIAQNGIEYLSDTAIGVVRGNTVLGNFYTGQEGLRADGTACGPSQGTTCPPGRLYTSTGILLVFVDPNNIKRGQNSVPGPGYPNGNQHPYAVVTDSPLD